MQSTAAHRAHFDGYQREMASRLYTCVRKQGQRGQVWAGLRGRSRELLDLEQVRAACSVRVQSDVATRSVAIDRICGSESRSADFDLEFNPLREHNRDRWLRIAEARAQGKSLPPVALIQVGDRYFVGDGHHRISVARALGQQTIEAKVAAWEVVGPLPWETSMAATDQAGEEFLQKIQRQAVQLRQKARLGLRNLLGAAAAAPAR